MCLNYQVVLKALYFETQPQSEVFEDTEISKDFIEEERKSYCKF